ncbi:rhodanese-like domain-containing protein [Campylobacter sp. 19-13652]|uniref:rhodanese-like domain-containing protein n=1 Tax=Campylobacter sp. 19-13652 TaxID=2840180 RepID=UPI001C759142|nr:rhodanese-like domain-containing protein [Campylobacter sp. 19-13652]BCX79558.1 hypothetical protein LBC_10200 [Campylobacter sp. 19-13652]
MKEIKRLLATKELVDSASQILDVRSPFEWDDTGVIAGCKKVSLYNDDGLMNENFVSEVDDLGFNKDEPLYVICHSGVRSQAAAQILARVGFKEPVSLDGGVAKLGVDGYEFSKE